MLTLKQHLDNLMALQPNDLTKVEKLQRCDQYLCDAFDRAIKIGTPAEQKRFMELMTLIWVHYCTLIPEILRIAQETTVKMPDKAECDVEEMSLYEALGRYAALAYKHIDGVPNDYTQFYIDNVRQVLRTAVQTYVRKQTRQTGLLCGT